MWPAASKASPCAVVATCCHGGSHTWWPPALDCKPPTVRGMGVHCESAWSLVQRHKQTCGACATCCNELPSACCTMHDPAVAACAARKATGSSHADRHAAPSWGYTFASAPMDDSSVDDSSVDDSSVDDSLVGVVDSLVGVDGGADGSGRVGGQRVHGVAADLVAHALPAGGSQYIFREGQVSRPTRLYTCICSVHAVHTLSMPVPCGVMCLVIHQRANRWSAPAANAVWEGAC